MPEKDPKKLHYVVLEDLPFCRLDLGYLCRTVIFHDDIWKYKLTYEQLMERLQRAKFSENLEAFLKLITQENEAKIHVTVECTDGDFAEFTLKSEEITEVIPYV